MPSAPPCHDVFTPLALRRRAFLVGAAECYACYYFVHAQSFTDSLSLCFIVVDDFSLERHMSFVQTISFTEPGNAATAATGMRRKEQMSPNQP